MFTVKSNTFPSETVAFTSRIEDAFAMCSKVDSEVGNRVENIRKLTSFDEYIGQHNGYVCVNEFYEDDEGFNKNSYMYGELVYANGENYVKDVKDLDGLSSNSFAKWDEAEKVFRKKVDMIRS
jgi:hypothetical protein|tara:strand:- start:381 stop:749 length:369 start_codon:yes stop_codon:yes gene_type:complete